MQEHDKREPDRRDQKELANLAPPKSVGIESIESRGGTFVVKIGAAPSENLVAILKAGFVSGDKVVADLRETAPNSSLTMALMALTKQGVQVSLIGPEETAKRLAISKLVSRAQDGEELFRQKPIPMPIFTDMHQCLSSTANDAVAADLPLSRMRELLTPDSGAKSSTSSSATATKTGPAYLRDVQGADVTIALLRSCHTEEIDAAEFARVLASAASDHSRLTINFNEHRLGDVAVGTLIRYAQTKGRESPQIIIKNPPVEILAKLSPFMNKADSPFRLAA